MESDLRVFVRHAALPPFQGYADRNALPEMDASRAAADVISNAASNFDTVSSSPLARCLTLAEAIGRQLRIPVQVIDGLQEMRFGPWEGKLFSDFEATPEFVHYMANWETAAPPGGESLPEFESRIRAIHWPTENTLIVTHKGVIQAMHVIVKGWSWDQAISLAVPPITPFEL